DGMWSFFVDGRTVLAVNNEFVNRSIIYGNRATGLPENADDVRKGKAGHGVSVFEIEMKDGAWRPVLDSPFNRRITADTPMEITGPARGVDQLKTAADPTGTVSLGTWNNCGNGRTPWGTYLTCEENFNGYFSSSDPDYAVSDAMKRYGVGLKDWGYAWATADERFDISKHPNEPNRAGYVVEIDPLDPDSTPKKRTALGRFKHENAELVIAANGHAVVYMGDDERGEFLYRFVSEGRYVEGGDNSGLLESGSLSVARFAEDGSGEWLALTPETTGMASAAEVAVHARMAGSTVGATTMDRPEWVAAHPARAEVYCCLTNNKNRGKKPNKGGDPTPVGGPNPRAGNKYGQIVRWRPAGGDHTAAGFEWDLFVVAGNPAVHDDDRAGSANVTPDNMFNSPDGLMFDSKGGLWIQTDGNYKNEGDFAGQGNNQMLYADADTGEINRFLVGPQECEVTGICWSRDRKTMFVGLQHPGAKGGSSHFPGGGETVPRSTVIAVTRDDGGEIG
ncbi:MAG: PhoX family phosphatase, partial [Alphaproteobacteria bacterium]|nr:PhoX family phosphatase [Alphaproteobacteria bacterium]